MQNLLPVLLNTFITIDLLLAYVHCVLENRHTKLDR